MKHRYLASAFGLLALTISAPASAQIGSRPDWNYTDEAPQPYYESRRGAYDNGFREGLKEGEREARRRDRYDFRDERTWQRADKGYHRSFGDRARYQQSFRSGYEAGYAEAYRRYRGSYGGYPGPGGGTYPNTRGDYGNPRPVPPGDYGYPGRNGYPNQYPNQYPGSYGSYGNSPAYSNGVNDGYQKGREDARDRDSFDPNRHKWYRNGDHNYKGAYGLKVRYQELYRRGFEEGYERGYRELGYRR